MTANTADANGIENEIELNGVFVPHVTPLTSEGDIDEQSLRRLIQYFNGVDGLGGLISCTRVGEGPVLTFEEKRRVFEIVTEEIDDDLPYVSTIAPRSTDEAVEKAIAAQEAGTDAVMVIPPLLFAWGNTSPEMRYRFFQELDERAGVPIVLFQVPIESYWYEPETLGRISQLESVIGIKEASFNVSLFTDVVHTLKNDGGEIDILSGNDRFLAQSFMLGIDGALVGVANVLPERWVEMYDLARQHRYAEALEIQEELLEVKELLFRQPIVTATSRIKYCLKLQGIIEDDYVRSPQPVVADDERADLRDQLITHGALEGDSQ
ncbi:dihydrodipicolinate synthase family protein [Natrinema versiforme]|uniref:Dihydrodipicolinate synthase family protein n=1 Tax=Natrinema versiforme TaxID=88724 RepID=A0A4V1G0D7_9EURY|nr:dihydrodipicolinate synthase family protein [Natrinema versiforme]QCS44986.1 dihydrodipicolinate synthase family protein [Natrinema versiforme]